MNQLVVKRAAVFALILGGTIGLLSLIPAFIGFCMFILTFFSAPIIIFYMKKNEKHLGIINTEQGAILGGIIGFCATIGFFITFSPMVCIIKLIFRSYYVYMIPDMLKEAIWLFFIIVFIVSFVFAATNAASAMGVAWLFSRFEKLPADENSQIDIEVKD